MGLNEGPNDETDTVEFSPDYVKNNSITIFTLEDMRLLINTETFLIENIDNFELLPPFSAEIQETGTNDIDLYYKDENGDLNKIKFSGANLLPKPELIQKLNIIGFNIDLNNMHLFGSPVSSCLSSLRERKSMLIRTGKIKL